MNAFGRMVRQKRKKMLVFVLLLVVLPLINVRASVNLTYILVKSEGKLRPTCVAEEFERYAALGWVYPMPRTSADIPEIVTEYVPNIENDYNCKFSKNDICIKRWIIKDWQVDENSTSTREFISDSRWEDLHPLFISNQTKAFSDRIDVEGMKKVSFSARAIGLVELFVCSGWDPYNYPCYYFHVNEGEVLFNKFLAIPSKINIDKTTSLTSYKAFSNVMSPNEWRNFIINFDESGRIEFSDIGLNRTLIRYVDKDPIVPRYMLMRSEEASLWNIVENNFMYTKTAQLSRFGPQVTFNNKDLCISLLVSTCKYCQMDFFYIDNKNTMQPLKHVEPTEDWIEIKLKKENIEMDKIIIFVKTNFTKEAEANKTEGFWAVDDVRVCHENEVKVSFMDLNQSLKEEEFTEESISCQIISKPHWRPKKILYNEIEDFPPVTITNYNSDSIKLSWKKEDPQNQLSYVASYQGIDQCNGKRHDLKRIKSNGFVSTKHNELVLENLIPYTMYVVNVTSIIHKNPRSTKANTAESDEPTFEEVPYNIKVSTTNTTANISWDMPACEAVRGRLIYDIIITNEKLNFTKRLEQQTKNEYYIVNLKPFTMYNFKIFTSRNARNLYRNIGTIASQTIITTKPGVSPPVKNLEVYAVDKNSVSLRFDLPDNSRGIPQDLQLRSCTALLSKKCKPTFHHLLRCKLWPNKYCVDKTILIAYQKYNFFVSIKNIDTHTYGEESEVQAFTTEHVPGAPTNISSKIVDCQNDTEYCHLNISWFHPYNQNGSIKMFNVILSQLSSSKEYEQESEIKDIYKISNDSHYMRQYSLQVKYIPYSVKYNVSIQSANEKFKSEFTTKEIKTADIGDHIDQSPKLLANSDSALIFTIPHLDRRLTSYTLTVVVQDYDRNKSVPKDLMEGKVGDNICHRFGETWISQTLMVDSNDTNQITIGTHHMDKHRIKPNTKYCITFIITNKYKDTEHDVIYYEKIQTSDAPKEAGGGYYNHLYVLLILLLLIPIGFLIYRFLRKRRILQQPEEPNENVYETLPFDEYDNRCVNNINYDQLLHK